MILFCALGGELLVRYRIRFERSGTFGRSGRSGTSGTGPADDEQVPVLVGVGR
jgi:hypothetical protein